jgi:hypothetical protein
MPDDEIDAERELADRKARVNRLVLAAEDCRQAAAAARALLDRGNNIDYLYKALETAMVVCYVRPFTRADGIGTLPRTDAPRDSEQARLHKDLCVRRRQVYAHTDAQSGRSGDAIVGESGGISGRAISTHAFTYPRDQLQAVVDLCEQQAAKFEQEAFAIQSEMNERNRDSPS